MPGGSGGRPSPVAIAHPWTTGAYMAAFVLVAWFVLNAVHGTVDLKSIVIGVIAALVVFLLTGLVVSLYRLR